MSRQKTLKTVFSKDRKFVVMREDRERVRRLRGDGLSVKMDSNNRVLEVTGDGCKITLAKNCGSVRVVGDGCRVKITHNVGDIVYTGDGGRVLLGPKSSTEKVKYFGEGGKVTFDSEPKKRNSSPRKEDTGSNVSVILKNYYGADKEKKREATMFPEVKNNLCKLTKDKTERKKEKKEGNEKTAANVFLTSSNESKDLFGMEKWFVAPTTVVVGSFANDVPTVTVREKKSMTNSTN